MIKLLAETCGTVAGAVLVKSVITNWVSDYMEQLFRHFFVRTKKQYIVWTHSVKHKDKLPEHNAKLFVCKDPPCDLLHTNGHDLGLPPGN
jgi:hypothetical protein